MEKTPSDHRFYDTCYVALMRISIIMALTEHAQYGALLCSSDCALHVLLNASLRRLVAQ